MEHMLWVGEGLVSLGRCRSPQEVIAQVEKISADDISAAAKEIFQPALLHVALVGPLKSGVVRSMERSLSF
jgi:predicted Zn-dependent peptidase